MDDDLMYANIVEKNKSEDRSDIKSINFVNEGSSKNQLNSSSDKILDQIGSLEIREQNQSQNNKKAEENVDSQFIDKESKFSLKPNLFEETKSPENSGLESTPNNDKILVEKYALEIQSLNEELNKKIQQNSELNSCLIKQTSLSQNLSDLLKTSQEKNTELEASIKSQLCNITELQADNSK